MLLFAQAESSADVQDQIFDLVGNSIYGILALLSLWGLYLVVVTWRRVGAKRFKHEKQLNEFLAVVEEPLLEKDFEGSDFFRQVESHVWRELAVILGVRKRSDKSGAKTSWWRE